MQSNLDTQIANLKANAAAKQNSVDMQIEDLKANAAEKQSDIYTQSLQEVELIITDRRIIFPYVDKKNYSSF